MKEDKKRAALVLRRHDKNQLPTRDSILLTNYRNACLFVVFLNKGKQCASFFRTEMFLYTVTI